MTPTTGTTEFGTAAVCKMTGASPRQLQWWDENKFVVPKHFGHRRVYQPEQVEAVRRIIDLRKAGAGLQQVRKIMRIPDWHTVVATRKRFVVVDGTVVVFVGR